MRPKIGLKLNTHVLCILIACKKYLVQYFIRLIYLCIVMYFYEIKSINGL